MSPELALVAVVAFLWGPTAVWLVVRAARGKPQASDKFVAGSPSPSAEPWSRPGAAALTELVDREAFWACAGCRSLNRPTASRCYSCAAPRRDAGELALPEAPLRGPDAPLRGPETPHPAPALEPNLVPVMEPRPVSASAHGAVPRPQPGPVPASAAGSTAQAQPQPAPAMGPRPIPAALAAVIPVVEPRPVPVMALGAAAVDRARVAVGPGIDAAGAAQAICPFLRLAGARGVSGQVPSRDNRCRAGLALSGSTVAEAPGREAKIALETQQALCLSAWYAACGRHEEAGTGRLPAPPEPEVAMLAAVLQAAAGAETSETAEVAALVTAPAAIDEASSPALVSASVLAPPEKPVRARAPRRERRP